MGSREQFLQDVAKANGVTDVAQASAIVEQAVAEHDVPAAQIDAVKVAAQDACAEACE